MYLRTWDPRKFPSARMTKRRITPVSDINMTLVAVLFIAAFAVNEIWAADISPIFPEKSVTLYVDPANNTAGGFLLLHNNTAEERNISLTARDFVSMTTMKGLNAKVVFFGPGDSAGQAIFKGKIPSKGQFPVRVEATNLWEAGESEAPLYDHGDEIGKIKALKYRPPFNVKLVSVSPDKPEISFYEGKPQSVMLRNEDGMTYTVHWTLTVDSDGLEGSSKDPANTQTITLSPNGSNSMTVAPKDSWFTAAGFFREEIRDGLLTLSLQPPGSKSDPGWPVKVIPFRARLNRAPEMWLQFCSYLLIFVLLLGGGVCSLMASHWVPNHLARARIKDRLSQLAERIRDLSSRIDSRLQVSLRVARHRLDKELYTRKSFSAELPIVLGAVTQKSDNLEKLIDQVAEIDRQFKKLERLYEEGRSSPKRLETAGALLQNAKDYLSRIDPPQADIQTAQNKIIEAKGVLEKVDQEDTKFAQALLDRLKSLQSMRTAVDPPTTPPTYTYPNEYEDYREVFEKLFAKVERFKNATADAISGGDYGLLDICLTKMELLREYGTLLATFDEEAKKKLDEAYDFRACIRTDKADKLRFAKRIVKQMRERIFPWKIIEDIKNSQTQPIIRMEPQMARQYSPMYFTVEFQQPDYNSCAALEEIKCEWDFGHDGLKEWGWRVYHYFPRKADRKERHCVRADITVAGGAASSTPDSPVVVTKEFEIEPESPREFGDRNLAELTRLGIVLTIALLSLLAGAREQLLKLDLIPAAVAVFLLGFSADAIKNLLVTKEK